MVVTGWLACDYDPSNRTPTMKLTNWTDSIFPRLCVAITGALGITRPTLMCLFAAAISLNAMAQEGVAPAPVATPLPRDLQQAPVGGTPVVSPLEAGPRAYAENPLQWGALNVRPHLFYRLLYGDGIQSSPGNQLTTTIHAISPGILFEIGDHWTLDYTPTKTFYSNRAFRDTFDNALQLRGATTFEEWVFGLSGSYVSSTQPLVQTGMQTKQEAWSTTANVGYHMGSRMLLDSSVSHSDQSAEAFTSSREWSTSDWLHYQIAPEWDTALGFAAGTVDVSAGSDMTYTRPQAQIGWRATNKLSFNVQGGLENRKFKSGGASDLSTPTYGASLRFQPVETTTLTFGASRTVSASYFTSQVTRSTGWTASLDQRLLEHLHLAVGIGKQKSSYIATDGTVAAGRDDDINNFNVRLSTTILRKVSIAALYQNSHNSSNLAGYAFSSSQVGLEIGWRF
jgi:hypothetical protein